MRRPLAALLFAALAILLAWGVQRLLQTRGTAAAARILPSDSILYIEAHDTAALRAALRDSPLAGRYESSLESPLAGWLARHSRPAALALWADADRSRLSWAVVSDLRAGERSLLAALGGPPGSTAAPVLRRHRGESFSLVSRHNGEALCAGQVGQHLVVASDEAAYRRVLDTAAGGASLASTGRLERGRRHLDAAGFLFAYADASRLGFPGSFEGIALVARLGPSGWLERFHLVSDPGSAPLLVELLARPPCAPDPGTSLPSDADLLVSLCAGGLEALYEPAVEALARRGAAGDGWKERLRGVEQLTGLSLKRELLGALGERHSAALSWEGGRSPADRSEGGAPAIVAALEIARPAEFQQVLERLSGFGRATGRLRSERVGDREVTILEGGGGAPALAWVLEDRRFLAAREPKRLEEALAAVDAGNVLADAGLKEIARRLAPAEVNVLAILRGDSSPTLLWAVGCRDGIHGEVHAPQGIILEWGVRSLERWQETQKPRAK